VSAVSGARLCGCCNYKDLRRARADLDRVWTGATAYQRIKARYDDAEETAISEAVAELDRLTGGDCREYLRLLTQLTATRPPRVAAEAKRRVRCVADTAPARCDAAALAATGKEQVSTGQLAAALTSYEAAFACKPELHYLRKACVIACDLRDPRRAKAIWKRLSPEDQTGCPRRVHPQRHHRGQAQRPLRHCPLDAPGVAGGLSREKGQEGVGE
jgi:hypothetical protein